MDDIDEYPSRALIYELSSLVKLSDGVGFVGVQSIALADDPRRPPLPAMCFLRLERNLLPPDEPPFSNESVIGRSISGCDGIGGCCCCCGDRIGAEDFPGGQFDDLGQFDCGKPVGPAVSYGMFSYTRILLGMPPPYGYKDCFSGEDVML